MTTRPRLLILSFSPLATDARLLKQIRAFSHDHDVTTCGFGPPPVDGVEHVELTPGVPQQVRRAQSLALRARSYRLAYWLTPYVRQARQMLRGREFDAVLANDLDTAGLAVAVSPGDRIHLDLHEFWPALHDNVPQWARLWAPFHSWQLRTWGRRVRSATTVNGPIARRYEREYGIACAVVTNAAPHRDLEPVPARTPVRLVHAGAINPGRKIEHMIEAVARSTSGATLDLYLMGEGTPYREHLSTLAHDSNGKVRVLPPVPQADLVETLHQYDVGIHVLAPTNGNNALALPNKFFDFVQARLAIVTGPTPPMVELLEQHGLGLVTEDFSVEAITRAVDSLDAARVDAWKRGSDAAASALAAERQVQVWREAVDAIITPAGGTP